jgi:hypothetical protein
MYIEASWIGASRISFFFIWTLRLGGGRRLSLRFTLVPPLAHVRRHDRLDRLDQLLVLVHLFLTESQSCTTAEIRRIQHGDRACDVSAYHITLGVGLVLGLAAHLAVRFVLQEDVLVPLVKALVVAATRAHPVSLYRPSPPTTSRAARTPLSSASTRALPPPPSSLDFCLAVLAMRMPKGALFERTTGSFFIETSI